MGCLAAAAGTPREAVSVSLYQIRAETLMPHLAENLRYARTQECRCVRDQDASGFFPVLQHPSLEGCRLGAGHQGDDATYYSLACQGSNGTTGTARVQGNADALSGELTVRMGGKNMTFSQRVEARREGDCEDRP